MAIKSTFYDTSSTNPDSLVTEVKWAKAHPNVGASTYGVQEVGDFKVTTNTGAANTVNVAPGTAWGHGVLDVSDSTVAITTSAPASGLRWDMVAIRRNWAPAAGGPTSIVNVQGGVDRALPAGRVKGPGTMDDQPIALVLWAAGETTPREIVDLRCWGGNGGMVAKDLLVRSYLDRVGAHVTIDNMRWIYDLEENDIPRWVRDGDIQKTHLWGASTSPLVGTSPSVQVNIGEGFLIQAGTQVAYADGAGFTQCLFQKPFPRGLLTIILTNGDSSIDRARGQMLQMAVAGQPWHTGNLHDFVYSVTTPDGKAAPNQLHRVNWIAIGW